MTPSRRKRRIELMKTKETDIPLENRPAPTGCRECYDAFSNGIKPAVLPIRDFDFESASSGTLDARTLFDDTGNFGEATEPARYHSIAEAGEIPEDLKSVFEYSRIDTVEQAVGFLCASGVEVEGRDAFLVRAREVLGEEAYAKYSTPLKQPPLGCDERKAEVEDVTVKAEGDDVAAVEK